jgi:hypothetical protein
MVFDVTLRLITVIVIFGIVLLYGSAFEAPYSNTLVELHNIPVWRFALAIVVLVGSLWSPRVGILVALGVFLYLSDLEKLTIPLVPLESR